MENLYVFKLQEHYVSFWPLNFSPSQFIFSLFFRRLSYGFQ